MTRELMLQQRAVIDKLLTAHEGLDKARTVMLDTTTTDGPLLKLTLEEAHEVWARRVALAEIELDDLRSQETAPCNTTTPSS